MKNSFFIRKLFLSLITKLAAKDNIREIGIACRLKRAHDRLVGRSCISIDVDLQRVGAILLTALSIELS
jgi:hypothetical protein